MLNFYTYFHTRNDTGAVFYIGKGSGKRAVSNSDRNSYWKNVVAKHGHTVHIAMKNLSESDAFEHEKFLILCFKDIGVSLANHTDGGGGISGYSHTDESKKKIALTSKERMLDPDYRAKIHGKWKGQNLSADARSKISAVMKGKPKSEEHRKKIGDLHRGMIMSEEAKAKISAAGKGRKRSLESRQKVSQSAKLAWVLRRAKQASKSE